MDLVKYVETLMGLESAQRLSYMAVDIKNMVHDLYSTAETTTQEYATDNLRLQGVGVYAFLTDLSKYFDADETSIIADNDLNGLCANITVRRMSVEQGIEYMMTASDSHIYSGFLAIQRSLLVQTIEEVRQGKTAFDIGNELGNQYPVDKPLV